jgi:hypothetical protein
MNAERVSAEAGALVPPTSVGGAPLNLRGKGQKISFNNYIIDICNFFHILDVLYKKGQGKGPLQTTL